MFDDFDTQVTCEEYYNDSLVDFGKWEVVDFEVWAEEEEEF